MKQISVTQYGPANVLDVVETSIPEPGAGEILLKVTAIGVNYSDVLRRRNTYFMPTPLPYVLGSEAVGEVVKRGKEVANPYPIGSKVLAILPAGGGYAEYVTADAQYCIPLPPPVDDRSATAIFVQGTTAHLLVHQTAKDVAGKTVLIHAASGGVGSLLVQLAKLAGATVIAAGSSKKKLEVAQSLGADLIVDYSMPNWTDALIEQNHGELVDFVFEMVGGTIYETCIKVLKPGGSIIAYGAASGQPGCIPSERFVDKNQHLLSFNLAHFIQHETEKWQTSLGAMVDLIASGQVSVLSPNAYPLAEAATAHADLEARKTSGKVVLFT